MGLECLDAILGLAHAGFQLVEAPGQRLRNLPGGVGAHVGLFGEIGLRHRVGEARRLLRIAGGDAHVDDIGAVGALDLDGALERIERGEGRIGGGNSAAGVAEAERRHQLAQRPRRAAEIRVAVERFRLDHAAQHAVGREHPHLAFDLQHGGVADLSGRHQLAADGVQIGRVDENLRVRGVAVRHEDDDQDRDEERCRRGPEYRCLAAPDRGPESLKIEGRKGVETDGDIARPGGCRFDLTRRFEHTALQRAVPDAAATAQQARLTQHLNDRDSTPQT